MKQLNKYLSPFVVLDQTEVVQNSMLGVQTTAQLILQFTRRNEYVSSEPLELTETLSIQCSFYTLHTNCETHFRNTMVTDYDRR